MTIEIGSDIIGVSERSWRSEERHNFRKGCLPIDFQLPISTTKELYTTEDAFKNC